MKVIMLLLTKASFPRSHAILLLSMGSMTFLSSLFIAPVHGSEGTLASGHVMAVGSIVELLTFPFFLLDAGRDEWFLRDLAQHSYLAVAGIGNILLILSALSWRKMRSIGRWFSVALAGVAIVLSTLLFSPIRDFMFMGYEQIDSLRTGFYLWLLSFFLIGAGHWLNSNTSN